MRKEKVSLSTLELTNASIVIKLLEEDLIKKKEDYRTSFLEQVKLLYPILRENGKKSENWNNLMCFSIGTTIEEIPCELQLEIALERSPVYLDLLCHMMVGCLVLQRKLTCNIGTYQKKTADILSVIKQTADMIGLGVEFSTKEKEGFRGNPYKDRYATFFLKKE